MVKFVADTLWARSECLPTGRVCRFGMGVGAGRKVWALNDRGHANANTKNVCLDL